VRERPRLYRRRRRRSNDDTKAGEPTHDPTHQEAEPDEPWQEPAADVAPPAADDRPFWQRWFGKKPPPPTDPRPIELILRSIHSHAQGPTRLDAYESAIEVETGTKRRQLALLLQAELLLVTERSGADLSLFDARVRRCAGWLAEVGEHAHAGVLLDRAQLKDAAQEQWTHAGDVQALEAAAADEVLLDVNGHGLRLAVQRFEARTAANDRLGALRMLAEAVAKYPQQHELHDRHNAFKSRFLKGALVLLTPSTQHACVWTQTTVLGRGEQSPLQLSAPTVAREHVALVRHADHVSLEPRQQRSPTLWQEAPLVHATKIASDGVLRMGPMEVAVVVKGPTLHLSVADRRLDVLGHGHAELACHPPLHVRVDEHGLWLSPQASVRLNGATVSAEVLLIDGDQLRVGDNHWQVRHRHGR
jgi:hypothetical protein